MGELRHAGIERFASRHGRVEIGSSLRRGVGDADRIYLRTALFGGRCPPYMLVAMHRAVLERGRRWQIEKADTAGNRDDTGNHDAERGQSK